MAVPFRVSVCIEWRGHAALHFSLTRRHDFRYVRSQAVRPGDAARTLRCGHFVGYLFTLSVTLLSDFAEQGPLFEVLSNWGKSKMFEVYFVPLFQLLSVCPTDY